MKKIMFNDRFGLTKAVLDGTKTMTRRAVGNHMTNDDIAAYLKGFKDVAYNLAPYKIGEIVAVAQPYKDAFHPLDWVNRMIYEGEKGWGNKMFVRADLMPHQIRITDIKVECLQDISDEDCMKEGIYRWKDMEDCPESLSEIQRNRFGYYGVWDAFSTPRKAFASLIDKVSGKGTWDLNPWNFAYEFELVK